LWGRGQANNRERGGLTSQNVAWHIRKTLNYLFHLNPPLACLKWHIK
jgi:hypothetical protein